MLAARSKSSLVMPASFMMSATCLLASSLNLSSSVYGEVTVLAGALDGRNVVATPVAKLLAVSATLAM